MAALAQLAGSLFRALSRMSRAPVVDDKVLGDCLNNVSRALLLADVRFETVRAVQASIRSAVSHRSLAAAGTDRRRIIKLAVEAELHRILDPGPSPSCLAPTRGKKPTSVVMLVGLQGSGKTTTCVKYADYHRRKGFSPALVCADTFRGADALDQLRHTAAKAGIPLEFVYGSYTESDPVKVAVDGVDRFRNAADLIVVDTSGLHGQEEETRQVAEATRPDLVVLVVDATIGQAAFHQALALKQSAGLVVGAVIVTKMDGNAKVVGALSAVAATKISPVIFIGTGEHVADLEAFDASSVARRLLSMGDLASCTCRRHARNSCRSMLMPPLASCSVA